MTKPTLTYFDAPVSRGEECRLALHLAGVDFHDDRVKSADWPEVKARAPMNAVPFLDVPGKGTLAQSNAILAFIGRGHDLHPKDSFEAARHEAMMAYVEDLRAAISPTNRIADAAEKQKAREALASGTIPTWAARVEELIGDGPFFGGARLNVVDLKLYMMVRWLKSGVLDHVPGTVLDGYPKLNRLHDAVAEDARVKAWVQRFR